MKKRQVPTVLSHDSSRFGEWKPEDDAVGAIGYMKTTKERSRSRYEEQIQAM